MSNTVKLKALGKRVLLNGVTIATKFGSRCRWEITGPPGTNPMGAWDNDRSVLTEGHVWVKDVMKAIRDSVEAVAKGNTQNLPARFVADVRKALGLSAPDTHRPTTHEAIIHTTARAMRAAIRRARVVYVICGGGDFRAWNARPAWRCQVCKKHILKEIFPEREKVLEATEYPDDGIVFVASAT
jgi:hypothetical protein